ncbi:MAG: HD domain-containing protein [Candidatus Gracilibacteria bacterium]|nr:HD domain-containing protein [Candidatus Gracilibacteria bacterium]
MTKNILEIAKKYVNMLVGPLEDHYYHHYEHALEVASRSVEIGKKEGYDEETLEILELAGLFHDTGFIIQYDNNEYIGASIARNFLKSMLYPEDKIKKIEELIISTIPTNKAKNKLEGIIKDADTDNLGRDDFFEKGERLKNEIEKIKKIKILDPDWYHYSLNFLLEHKFVTPSEIKERQNKKLQNIDKLSKIVKNKNK